MSTGKVKIFKYEWDNPDMRGYPRGRVELLHQYQVRYGFLFLKVFTTNPNSNCVDALRELYSFIGRHKIGRWHLVKYIPKYKTKGLGKYEKR